MVKIALTKTEIHHSPSPTRSRIPMCPF